jgi:hypothetical protein
MIFFKGSDSEIEVTKREMFVTIIFLCLMALLGFYVSDYIQKYQADHNAKYYQAIKITNDPAQFKYALETNAGHMIVHGTVKAIDPVTYEGLDGRTYMTITRVYEEYRMHSKRVCSGDGKNRHCHTKYYWTWDAIHSEGKSVAKVEFLGQWFLYQSFPRLPGEDHVKTWQFESRKRYVFFARPTQFTGAFYAIADRSQSLKDHSEFMNGESCEGAMQRLVILHAHYWFWGVFIFVVLAIAIVFVAMENKWLYKRNWDRGDL